MASKRWWRRPVVIVPTAIVAVTALTLALAAFQPWRLFIDVTVDEALPTGAVEVTVEPRSDASAQQAAGDASHDASADSNAEEQPATESTVGADSAANSGADSPADSNAGAGAETSVEETPKRTVTAEGTFISHEHPTAGMARIITPEDGSRVLRLVGLGTDNRPDLKVWLAAAPVFEGRDGWFVFDDDEYLSLGALKGNQNYPIPGAADISDLNSVTI